MPVLVRWMLLLSLTIAGILVPFLIWGDRIETATASFLATNPGRWTTAAALAGLLGADIVLPVPSSLVSTAAGGLLGFFPGLATSFAGMSVGALLGYWLGRGARGAGALDDAALAPARAARDRWGDWALVLFRPVPVLAEASVFLAGLTGVPLRRFVPLTFAANLGISAAYAATGAYAKGKDSFLLAFAGAIALPALAMAITRLRRV